MRIALGIQYDGSQFCGWQKQNPPLRSVQEEVEKALSCIAAHPVQVHAAGRTDTGVHACGQVVHFDTPSVRTDRAWILGTNSYLPHDIVVTFSQIVPEDFHARFSAIQRTYLYVLSNANIRPCFLRSNITWHRGHLDLYLMQQAASCLIGEHDFTSFRALGCQAPSPIRHITSLQIIKKYPNTFFISVTAHSFLHHMIRNIVGALILVGSKQRPVGWMKEVLDLKDRAQGFETAPPYGLYLDQIEYPENFRLIHRPTRPYFLQTGRTHSEHEL